MYSWLEIIHYSRVPLILMSGSLAATTSLAILEQFDWRSVVIISLGTYVVYTIDNLLDWPKERHLLQQFEVFNHRYLRVSWVGIPVVLSLIVLLALSRSPNFLITLISLYMLSLIIILAARLSGRLVEQTLYYWVERFIVAGSWALVSVLVPMQAAHKMLEARGILTIIFVWQIGWVLGVVWRYSSVIYVRHQTVSVPYELARTKLLVNILKMICVTAFIQAAVDILIGFFPWYNAVVLLVPVTQYILLRRWDWVYRAPLTFCNTMFFFTFVDTLLITGLYAIATAS